MNDIDRIREQAQAALQSWITSCTRKGKVSRNTVAIGIVVLDHLRRAIPVTEESALSAGREIKGARSGLQTILHSYGIPSSYLKEVTTRQAHQDGQRLFEALQWGALLLPVAETDRDAILIELIEQLKTYASEWLARKNLNLAIDRRESPTAWISLIVESAKSVSGGVVEQHLIGAKLAKRHKEMPVPNHPAHAADQQTARAGDFTIKKTVYHVTATPSRRVIEKCVENVKAGLHPILLVPSEQEYRAKALAQEEQIDKSLAIISIEAFVALNIIEMAIDSDKDLFQVLEEIIETYNQRLVQVETDMSLRIDLR